MEDIAKKGLGEIIDELCTLSLKISHDIKFNESVDRCQSLLEYISSSNLDPKAKLILNLFVINSLCWVCQDGIKENNNPISNSLFSLGAQQTNKLRNIIIGELNDGTGIITAKSY